MMHSMSIGDKMAGAGITALMGMGITFVVLILLWALIALMSKFTYRPNKGDNTPQATNAPAAPSGEAAAANDNLSLIAVITAAVAACRGGSSNFIVRKIHRLSGETTAWSDAGRSDCIDSRKF